MQKNSNTEKRNTKQTKNQTLRHMTIKDEEYAAELLSPITPLEDKHALEEPAYYPRFTRGLLFGLLLSACLWGIIVAVLLILN